MAMKIIYEYMKVWETPRHNFHSYVHSLIKHTFVFILETDLYSYFHHLLEARHLQLSVKLWASQDKGKWDQRWESRCLELLQVLGMEQGTTLTSSSREAPFSRRQTVALSVLVLTMLREEQVHWPSGTLQTWHLGPANHLWGIANCLENPRDGGAWWAAVYGVAQSRTRLKRLSSSSSSSSQVVLVVKNLPANAGDSRDMDSIPGLGISPGVGNGNPLQYSCLENSTDRGAWRATVHGDTESQTQLSD